MKAGGKDAMFVAMTAVINARRRLKKNHAMDVMLVPQVGERHDVGVPTC